MDSKEYQIESIYLNNFLCFQNEVKIYPFSQITGIIGPNGIGKSSIIKALEFVLCKDLFYDKKFYEHKNMLNKNVQSKNCLVKLQLKSQNDRIEIQRLLKPNNKFEYKFDSQRIKEDQFLTKLEELRIGCYNILSQNDKDLFTSMTPDQLMLYMEKVSGSIVYQKEYKKAKDHIKHLEDRILEKNEFLRNLKKDRRDSMFVINSNEKAQQMISDFEQKELELYEITLIKYKIELKNISHQLQEIREEKNDCYQKLDGLTGNLREYGNKNFDKLRQQVNLDFQKQINKQVQLNNKINELDRIESELINDVKILDKDLKNLHEPKLKMQTEKLNDIIQEIDKLEKQKLNLIQNEHSKIKVKKSKNLLQNIKRINQLSEEKEHWQSEREKQKIQVQLQGEDLLKLKSSINKFHEDIREKKELLIDQQNNLIELESQMKNLQRQEVNYDQEKAQKNIQKEKIISIKNEIHRLQIQIDLFKGENNDFDMELKQMLEQRVEGFVGQIGDLVEPIDKKYGLALGKALSTILDYYVVEDMLSAREMSQILKNREIQKNVLILENAPKIKKQSLSELRNKLQRHENLAFDLLEQKIRHEGLSEYLVHYLKNVILVENIENGLEVRRRFSDRFIKVVTIKGEILTKNGVESYGSEHYLPKKIKKFLKKKNNTNLLTEEIMKLKQELNQIEKEDFSEYVSYEQNKLIIEKQLVQVKEEIKNLKKTQKDQQNELDQLELILEKREKDLLDQQRELFKNQSQCDQLEKNIDQIKKDVLKKENLNENQLDQVLLEEKDIKKEIILLSNKIEDLRFRKDEININMIEEQIERVQSQMEEKQIEIQEIREKRNEIQENQKKFTQNQVQMQEQLKVIRDDQNKWELSRNILIEQIKQEEQKLYEKEKREQKLYKDFQHTKFQIKNYLEEEELKGRGVQSQLMSQIEQVNTQIQSQDINLDQLVREQLLKKYEDKNLDQISEELAAQKHQLQNLKKKIDGLTVNLNDKEIFEKEKLRMENIQDQLSESKQNLELLIKQEKEAQEKLKQISSERNQKLKQFVDPLILVIGNYYKFVNCNNQAQANLIIENPFQYFSQGLIFSAVPINKHFTIGTESLSSGETILANLAMFLAINQIMKSSFIILDEVDANLDQENCFKFISSFGKYSKEKQILFISHKSYVFQHAHVLIGITKDHKKNSATCYHLELKKSQEII